VNLANIFVKSLNIKFKLNNGNKVVPCDQTDGLTNNMKLTVDVCTFFQKKPNKQHSADQPLLLQLFPQS